MSVSIFPTVAACAVVLLSAGPAAASTEIQRACMNAGRSAASPVLCGCVQDVAEAMFSRSERNRIVKFFKDPHLTQELRQSDRSSDERFWEKYKQFGSAVQANCN